MPRHRVKRQTMGKLGVKKADSFIAVIGPGTAVTAFEVLVTDVGARTLTGTEQTIQDAATTGETCRVGDLCKYVNLTIQAGPRTQTAGNAGWIEWAFVCHKENDVVPPSTELGTETMGTVCMRMYRGDCIYTGAIPIGTTQPVVANISLKIPTNHTLMKVGDQWHLFMKMRTVSTTETATDLVKLIASFSYKVYS